MNSTITPELAKQELLRRQSAKDELIRRKFNSSNNKSLEKNESNDLISKLVHNPLTQGVLGAGDSIRNLMSSTASLVPGVNISPVKSGEGTAYDIGKIAGNIGGFLGGGEILNAARAGAEGLPFLGNIAQSLGKEGLKGVGRRTLGAGIGGAIESQDNRLGGSSAGAGTSLAFELLPAALKGVGKFSEVLNPKKFANELAEKIAKQHDKSKSLASDQYNAVRNIVGESNITHNNPSSNYISLDRAITKFFTPTVNKLHDQFINKMTFDNAHKLQSQMGTEIGKLSGKKPDAHTLSTIQALQEGREALKKDMDLFLRVKDPALAEKYKLGNEIFKNEVAPYRANETIRNIVNGNIKNISPKKLEQSLSKLSDQGEINGHYLKEALQKLSKKINRGSAIGTLGSSLTGFGLGEAIAPGLTGGVIGATLGKLLGPQALKLSQNPEVLKLLEKNKNRYFSLRQPSAAIVSRGEE